MFICELKKKRSCGKIYFGILYLNVSGHIFSLLMCIKISNRMRPVSGIVWNVSLCEEMMIKKTSVVADIYLAKLLFLYGSKFGIERHQLSPGIFSGELPLDTGGMFIAVTLPCRQLLPKQIHVINPAGQALPRHDV